MKRLVLLIAGCGTLTVCWGADAPPAADATESADSASALQEIVVSAQRRSENLQNVPIAVSAVTSATLEQAGVDDMLALQAMVPGLTLTEDAGYSNVFLRGVGTTTAGATYEPSVATYVDGVYIGSSVGNMFSFNNIAQVEVLKGPQGTLFGRNATGGVINVTTRTPSQVPTLDASIGYANYNTVEGKIYGATGVTDNLAGDIAIYWHHQYEGWGYDPVTHHDVFQTQDLSLRSKWLFTPTDSTKLTFTWSHSNDQTDVGQSLHFLPGALGLDGATTYGGFYNSFTQRQDYTKVESTVLSLKAEQDLQVARLVSITAYQDLNFGIRFDQDATPVDIVNAFWTQPTNTLSEEIQLLSPEHSAVQWIAGMFFLNQRVEFPFQLEGLAAAPFSDQAVDFSNRLRSISGFGQATAEILPDTHLTLGVRYTSDQQEADGSAYGDGALLIHATPSETFDKVTWRAALDHQFTPDLLVYVSDNRGFKGGAFNQLSFYLPAVKPEVLDAYELGVKTELMDHRIRFNTAVYDYEYKDIQVQILPAGSQEIVNGAAARIYGLDSDLTLSVTQKLSLQAGVAWIHGRYTDFKDAPSYIPAPTGGNMLTTINATGNHTVHTPEYSGDLSATYRTPVPWGGNLACALTYSYSDGYYVDPDNRLRQPVTHLVNPSLTWTDPSTHWSVKLWAANALKQRYYEFLSAQATGDVGSPAAPATYGITFGVHY